MKERRGGERGEEGLDVGFFFFLDFKRQIKLFRMNFEWMEHKILKY